MGSPTCSIGRIVNADGMFRTGVLYEGGKPDVYVTETLGTHIASERLRELALMEKTLEAYNSACGAIFRLSNCHLFNDAAHAMNSLLNANADALDVRFVSLAKELEAELEKLDKKGSELLFMFESDEADYRSIGQKMALVITVLSSIFWAPNCNFEFYSKAWQRVGDIFHRYSAIQTDRYYKELERLSLSDCFKSLENINRTIFLLRELESRGEDIAEEKKNLKNVLNNSYVRIGQGSGGDIYIFVDGSAQLGEDQSDYLSLCTWRNDTSRKDLNIYYPYITSLHMLVSLLNADSSSIKVRLRFPK